MLLRIWEKGNSNALLIGIKIVAATMENIMRVPKRIMILDVYLKEVKHGLKEIAALPYSLQHYAS